MRRKDREVSEAQALIFLRSAEYGILGLSDAPSPYLVPLSFALIDRRIYIHCAAQGYKIDLVRQNPQASFCAVAQTRLVPEDLTTQYQSAVALGAVRIVNDPDEKKRALQAICAKYAPAYPAAGRAAIENSLDKIGILCLEIRKCTGKSNPPLPPSTKNA